jgi:serine phosphatase RsbU (regulator of sigma subunit)
MNGGATGSTSFIYIPAIILVIIIAKRKQQNLLFSIFLLNITILYFLEYYYGKKIIHKYDSPKNHYNDMAFVFYFVLILTFFLVRFFKRMFEDERNIVNRQKKIIEQQNKEHISSLVYASDLQKKIISNENQLKFLFEDYFVLFKPKDIVSGDFYWIKEKEEYGVIVVADCTGHGVPAALLSILGISLLEDVMEQLNGNWTASEFLEKLRVKFKFHLQKNNVSNEEKRDGIDLGVCVINYKESTFQFSGANRSLIMIRNNQTVKPTGLLEEETTNSHALYSYTATKNSVGFNYVELPFINHTIEYYPNDIFYVFSDGYSDQFDDSNKKKFKVKQLKKELLKIQDLPMYEQKEYLDELHKKWKGETEQTDDILIVGMKI